MDKHNKKCLTDYEIGAYMDGNLPDSEKEALENSLFACKECWEDFVTIKQAVIHDDELTEEMPASLMQKAINMYPESQDSIFNIVVGLVKDSIQVMHYTKGFDIFVPLPAGGLRSGITEHPSMVVIKKSFDEIEVELDVEKTGSDVCNIRVAVDDVIKKRSVKPFRVELSSNGRELVSNLLENGETFLEDIGTGHYTIKINRKGIIFGEISLKID
jgi:hypothetical protein